MSSCDSRSQSPETRFMSPTIASNVRAHHAEPDIPTKSSSGRNSRASSVQGSPSAPTSPKSVERNNKASSKVQAPSSRAGLTLSETSSSHKSVPAKLSQRGLNDVATAAAFEGNRKLQRTRFGDARAAREDEMGAAMAATALAKGLIDDETARNWATPWHQKGQTELKWSQEIIDKHNAENGIIPEKVMSLKEAEAIKKQKDQELEEWNKAHKRGLIDENGNGILSGAAELIAKPKSREQDAHRETTKKEEEKKDTLHKMQESRDEKAAAKKTSDLPTTAEASSPAPFLGPKPATKPAAKKAVKKTTVKPTQVEAENNLPAKENPYEAPIIPLSGYPSYAEFKYPDLSALCRERNIKSGGDEQKLRYRLIHDDTFVINGDLDSRDAKNYASRKDHDHPAPEVPNAPVARPAEYKRKTAKRAREDDEDDQPKSKSTSKKVKIT